MRRALFLILVACSAGLVSVQDQIALTKGDAPIYLRPDSTTTPLVTLPRDSQLEVLDVQETWLKVAFADRALGRRVGFVALKDVTLLSVVPRDSRAHGAAPAPPATSESPSTSEQLPSVPRTVPTPAPAAHRATASLPATATAVEPGVGLLSDDAVQEAVAIGSKQKGLHQGLIIRDSGQSFANALATSPGSTTGFELRLYTPTRWVRQLASNAAKEYRQVTAGEIEPEHRRLILRVFVEPDTPTHIVAGGLWRARSAQHVVLKDEKQRVVIQPVSKDEVNREVSNAMGGRATYSGLIATFDMAAVREIRGTNGGEFYVVVIGDKGREREFKIKQKHFEWLD